MDTRNLKRPSAPILPPDGGPQQPHLGPVTRSVAAGKPRPERRAPNPKRHRPLSRRPDCFSEKYRRLMEAMGGSDEGTGAGGSSPGGQPDQGAHGGPQQSPRHPDSYSVKFRTLMEVMGRSEEKRAGPDGGNVAAATPTTEAKGAKEERSGAERESGGRGGQEKSRSEDPAPLQNEEEEEEEEDEEHDNSAELDWMAAMVEALIDGELHQSQIREPEAVHMSPPTTQPILVPGPIGTERQSPSTWDGIRVSSDLEYSFFEDVLMGQQLPIPPLSLGQNLDLGQDPLDDLSLSDWPFLTDADLFLPKPSEPNTQPGQGPITPPSVPGNAHPGNGVSHLEN